MYYNLYIKINFIDEGILLSTSYPRNFSLQK